MTTIHKNMTLTADGSDDLTLSGQDHLTVTVPYLYFHNPLRIDSVGSNSLVINEPAGGTYNAIVTSESGTLTFVGKLTSNASVRFDGPGKVNVTATIGGHAGSAMTIDASDSGSNISVLTNGSLTFDQGLTFIKQAHVSLDDGGSPVGFYGSFTPSLTIDSLPEIAKASYGLGVGLRLDFANGTHSTLTGLTIADDQYYALTQQQNGSVTIQASARYVGSATQVAYTPPVTPVGGAVFHI